MISVTLSNMLHSPSYRLVTDFARFMMHGNLDRPREPLAAKPGADVCLEICRVAVFHQKASKGLQAHERLLGGAQEAQRQAEAVEADSPALPERMHVVHGDNRISADPRSVTAHELDRLFAAEHIDRVVLLQIADQPKILVQDPTRSRIPARIDDEDAKARRGGR